ncbi:hypothetical protein CBL_13485 [Carabus blaptoides fortunei]
MNFKRTTLSVSKHDIDIKTCGTIFCKTYTDTRGIKSLYFVITPPHISEIHRNGNSHHTIHLSSNRLVEQKWTDIRKTTDKGMLSFRKTCNTDIKYFSTYLSYIMPPLQEYLARPSVCNPNISSINLTEVQPSVTDLVDPSGMLNKCISIQYMIKEYADTLRVNSNTSKIRKLHIVTPSHLTGLTVMIDGMLSSLREGYEQDNMVTYSTYHENRLKKYKSPVQIAFEKLRWLCNILRPTKHLTIITVRDDTDSQTTYFDTQRIILPQVVTNPCGAVSIYYALYKHIYKPDTNSKLFLNALFSMKVLAIEDSADIRQPNVITPYFREPNMTCNPMLNIGRNVYDKSTDTLSLLLYAIMKTALEKQVLKTRRAIAKAKKAIEDLRHLPIRNEENKDLIICAKGEPGIIHAPTNMIESRLVSSYNNTPCRQQQNTKEKQDITYSIDDKVHVTDKNICTEHKDMTRVSGKIDVIEFYRKQINIIYEIVESTPEKTPRIWSIFNRFYNMEAPSIFTSLKNILRPTCKLQSTKSSKNQIQDRRTKHTSVEKQTKHSAKHVRAPKIEYEWTIFYPTYGDIDKKGGQSYLLHYKEIKKQVKEKPQNSRKYPVFKKPDSLPVKNRRATISGPRPSSYTSNHYFVVHFTNSKNELTAEDQTCPMARNVNGSEMNKITKDSIVGGKTTTFFKTYQDLNMNSLLRFQYHYRQ